jgi:hypothetical protein
VIAKSTTMAHCRADMPPTETTAIISRVAYTVRASAPPKVTRRASSVFSEGQPGLRSRV